MSNFDYWNDYWANDGKAGEVFVDVNGNKPDYLKSHWADFFDHVQSGSIVVDLGCGGGSIYSAIHVDDRPTFRLVGVDLSKQALQITQRNIGNVEGVRMSSSKTYFADQRIDVVVSQFGVEYAGMDGFKEASRILSKGGMAKFLCHHQDGYIDQRNKRFLQGAELAIELSFIPLAKQLTIAKFAGNDADIETAKTAFDPAKADLLLELQANKEGIHAHLYHGFMTLLAKYKSYRQSDIVDWLDAMHADISKNIAKVSAIRKVSLNEEDIAGIRGIFERAGCSSIDIKLLQSQANKDLPVAWDISVFN